MIKILVDLHVEMLALLTSPELLKLFFDFDILESSKLFSEIKHTLFISDKLLLFIRELNFNEFGLFLFFFIISRLRLSSNFEHENI
jgi:hypothetical protein